MKRFVICLLVSLHYGLAYGHESPYQYVVTSSFGDYLFVMACRGKGDDLPHGTAYRVGGDGRLEQIWHVNGWFEFRRNVYLSKDGKFLVRITEPKELGQREKTVDLQNAIVLQFYSNGKVIKTYKFSDIVSEMAKGVGIGLYGETFVTRISGRYPRISQSSFVDEVEIHEASNTEVFMLETIEGNIFAFNVQTGEKLAKIKKMRVNAPAFPDEKWHIK